MRILSDGNLKLFEQIVKMNEASLLKTMNTYLKRFYNKVTYTKDYVYAIGDIPITLVAHVDTVFKERPEDVFYDRVKNVLWSPQGLGADDRAGVFAIINIVKSGLRPHIIFTTGEEMGGLGAQVLTYREPKPFAEMKYIIQLDRRGKDDCIFYECDNVKFIEYIKSFGFHEEYGSFSDISELCPTWRIAGVNLSIGYKNEHSFIEILYIDYFLSTVEKVKKMLKDVNNINSFEYIPALYSLSSLNPTSLYKCKNCGKIFTEYELFLVKGIDSKNVYYCPDCIYGNVNWCDSCGKAYEIDFREDTTIKKCKDCRDIINV